MRIANLAGRAVLLTDEGAVDVHKASGGCLSSDPQALFERWPEARPELMELTGEASPYEESDLRAPVPRPGQIFAMGDNYREHVEESGTDTSNLTTWPTTFTKFASCLTGPSTTVTLPDGWVDWEVELVVVIGKRGHRVRTNDA